MRAEVLFVVSDQKVSTVVLIIIIVVVDVLLDVGTQAGGAAVWT